jgi:hypothetical protein
MGNTISTSSFEGKLLLLVNVALVPPTTTNQLYTTPETCIPHFVKKQLDRRGMELWFALDIFWGWTLQEVHPEQQRAVWESQGGVGQDIGVIPKSEVRA